MFKYGVNKATWGHFFDPDDFKTFFSQVVETGAEIAEFRPPDPLLLNDQQKIKETCQLAAANGIQMTFTFALGFDMRSEDAFTRKYAVEHLSAAIRTVAALKGIALSGVPYSTWPPRYDSTPITKQMKHDQTQRCIECIRQVMPLAEDSGVRLNMEVLNRFENYIINTAAEGIAFAKAVDSKNCALLLDTFHMSIEEDDIPAAIRSAKNYIGELHVTEPNRKVPFHNKRINWQEIGQTLKDIGFDKPIIIEAVLAFDDASSYNMRMWRDQIADTSITGRINEMKKGIAFLKEQFNDKRK